MNKKAAFYKYAKLYGWLIKEAYTYLRNAMTGKNTPLSNFIKDRLIEARRELSPLWNTDRALYFKELEKRRQDIYARVQPKLAPKVPKDAVPTPKGSVEDVWARDHVNYAKAKNKIKEVHDPNLWYTFERNKESIDAINDAIQRTYSRMPRYGQAQRDYSKQMADAYNEQMQSVINQITKAAKQPNTVSNKNIADAIVNGYRTNNIAILDQLFLESENARQLLLTQLPKAERAAVANLPLIIEPNKCLMGTCSHPLSAPAFITLGGKRLGGPQRSIHEFLHGRMDYRPYTPANDALSMDIAYGRTRGNIPVNKFDPLGKGVDDHRRQYMNEGHSNWGAMIFTDRAARDMKMTPRERRILNESVKRQSLAGQANYEQQILTKDEHALYDHTKRLYNGKEPEDFIIDDRNNKLDLMANRIISKYNKQNDINVNSILGRQTADKKWMQEYGANTTGRRTMLDNIEASLKNNDPETYNWFMQNKASIRQHMKDLRKERKK